MSGYISKGLKVFKPRIMDTCTYCPTGIACKCGYNCANCLKAKKLYLKIIKDTHKKYDPRLQTSTSPLLSRELKSNATVSTILPNNAPFEGDKTQKKKKEKPCFRNGKNNPKPQATIVSKTCDTTIFRAATNVSKSQKQPPITLWLLNNRFCQCWLDIPYDIYRQNIMLFNIIYFIWNVTIYTILLVLLFLLVFKLID
jgi:hypothetical protein